MKLIKMQGFVVGDDSVKDENWIIPIGMHYIDDTGSIRKSVTDDLEYWQNRKEYFKITHSTRPLSKECGSCNETCKKCSTKVKYLNITENDF